MCVCIAVDFAVDWILCLFRAKGHTVDGPFIAGAVLSNVLDRFAERGRIISYLVGTNGWLWVKMATAEQAARVAKRMDGVAILQGTVVLAVQQASASSLPSRQSMKTTCHMRWLRTASAPRVGIPGCVEGGTERNASDTGQWRPSPVRGPAVCLAAFCELLVKHFVH